MACRLLGRTYHGGRLGDLGETENVSAEKQRSVKRRIKAQIGVQRCIPISYNKLERIKMNYNEPRRITVTTN